MKSLGLKFFTDIHWTLIGLIIFVTCYVVLMALQQRQFKKDDIKRIEQLPFEGEGT